MAARSPVTSYEVLLTGSFPADEATMLREVENRLSLHTDTSFVLHRQDYDFELDHLPVSGLSTTRFPTATGAPLRVKRDLTAVDGRGSEWTLYTYSKPTRTYTTAVVRSCCSIPMLSGDALTFASAMGYRPVTGRIRKGYTFLKGSTTILLYQLVDAPGESNPNPWNIEVTQIVTIDTRVHIAPAALIQNSVNNVVGVAILMKGLVDLKPTEVNV